MPGEAPPASYGERHGRASSPSREEVARHGTAFPLALPAARGGRRYLEIDWAGDVARLELDGVVVADRFWDGTTWTVGLDALGLGERGDDDVTGSPTADAAELVLRIVPLHPDAAVHLPEAAAARRADAAHAASDAPLISLDAVRVVEAPLWRNPVGRVAHPPPVE